MLSYKTAPGAQESCSCLVLVLQRLGAAGDWHRAICAQLAFQDKCPYKGKAEGVWTEERKKLYMTHRDRSWNDVVLSLIQRFKDLFSSLSVLSSSFV